jgi:L-histidine N-alpha-methyltransferase
VTAVKGSAPSDAFYRTYSPAQVDAIVDSLTNAAEFPFELTYLGAGAEFWRAGDELSSGVTTPLLDDANLLLERHAEELITLVPAGSAIDVVDLGPGTTRPVQGLLRQLLHSSRLANYRAIDISPELLGRARRRLRTAFPDDAARFQLVVGDFTGPDVDEVLGRQDGSPDPVRFVVIAGGTLYNFPNPDRVLRHLRSRMAKNDLLLLTVRFDTGLDRPPFMDRVDVGRVLKPQELLGLELLNVDPSWYVTETGFDRDRSEIFVRARFRHPVVVTFDQKAGSRAVSFDTGDTVLLCRWLYHDRGAVHDQLTDNGFDVRLFRIGHQRQLALVAATP